MWSSSSPNPVFFPADLIPHQNPWLISKIHPRLWKYHLRPWLTSSLPPEYPCTNYSSWFCQYEERLKSKHMNPRIGDHDTGHKNKIEYCSYVRNQTINMNMPMFWRKSARTGSWDSMFRGQFTRTYSAIQGVLRSAFSCYGFRRLQARTPHWYFWLKQALTKNSISLFSKLFKFLVWLF